VKVTTLRLPEGMYEDLAEEADERDRSLSEYVRMLLRNRQPNTLEAANTPQNTQPDTTEYDDRLSELEARVAALETDETAGSNGEEPKHPRTDPHTQVVDAAVQWATEHQPVRRQEIIDEFVGDVDIKGDSLWKRHIRDALKEAGFEHDREGGIATWEQ